MEEAALSCVVQLFCSQRQKIQPGFGIIFRERDAHLDRRHVAHLILTDRPCRIAPICRGFSFSFFSLFLKREGTQRFHQALWISGLSRRPSRRLMMRNLIICSF